MQRNPSHARASSGAAMPRMRVAMEFEIPSDVRYIERVVEFVTRQCQEFAYNPRQVALNVPVALTEALSNAILRGNGESAGKAVQVRADMDRDRLVLEVVDEGTGFDIDACRIDPTSPDNITREDGRGLFLMTQLMDHIERFSNRGNVVRMTLRRHD